MQSTYKHIKQTHQTNTPTSSWVALGENTLSNLNSFLPPGTCTSWSDGNCRQHLVRSSKRHRVNTRMFPRSSWSWNQFQETAVPRAGFRSLFGSWLSRRD